MYTYQVYTVFDILVSPFLHVYPVVGMLEHLTGLFLDFSVTGLLFSIMVILTYITT